MIMEPGNSVIAEITHQIAEFSVLARLTHWSRARGLVLAVSGNVSKHKINWRLTVAAGDTSETDKGQTKPHLADAAQNASPGDAFRKEYLAQNGPPSADKGAAATDCNPFYKHTQNAADLSVSVFDECFAGQTKKNGDSRKISVPMLRELEGFNTKGEITHEEITTQGKTKESQLLNVYMHNKDSVLKIQARGEIEAPGTDPLAKPDPSDPTHAVSQIKETGTAFFISKDGLMATDYHCVEDGPNNVWVTMPDGTQRKGTVVDKDLKQDLALVKLQLNPGEEVQPVQLGDSKKFLAGERMVSMGKAWGKDETSMSVVRYQGLDHQDSIGLDPNVGNINPRRSILRTDGLVVPGDSGGPIFRADGTVAMMNVYSNVQNRMWGIPVERLQELVNHYERTKGK